MFADLPLLSLLVWLPILGGVAVLLSGDKGDANGVRVLSLVISLATFFLSLGYIQASILQRLLCNLLKRHHGSQHLISIII